MTITDYMLVAFGVLFVSLVCVQIVDRLDRWWVARCIRRLGAFECPRCHKAIGAVAMSTAKEKMIKFTGARGRRLRGRDYPSRLVTTTCPHCSAELDFRLDGSLFSCNHEVVEPVN
jgi:hypothetical protein